MVTYIKFVDYCEDFEDLESAIHYVRIERDRPLTNKMVDAICKKYDSLYRAADMDVVEDHVEILEQVLMWASEKFKFQYDTVHEKYRVMLGY